MRVRFTPRARADAARMTVWWRRHRSKASDLFEEELRAALARIALDPTLGTLYETGDARRIVRRILMPKTRAHVYYTVLESEVVVLAVWGAVKRRATVR